MEIGIGLPNAVPGVSRDDLLEFARKADQRGFSSLGCIDRIVYPNYEPLVAFAAAAAVTERIRLTSSILIAPYRNTALFAKQALTIQALSGGRLTLGLAIGAREDDYEATDTPLEGRGARLESQLDEMKRIFAGEERGHAGAIGPQVDPPPIVLGGSSPATYRRAAKYGDGWIMAAVGPDQFADGATAMREAWEAEGRDGEPRLLSIAYYGLGPNAAEEAEKDLKHYYEWLGDDLASMIAGGAATDDEAVKGLISAFEGVGCQELILIPVASDPEQVDLLADLLGM